MYTEREMTLDALEIAKTSAVNFTQAASEANNPNLRQAILHMRSQCEQAQQQIGQYAQNHQFYLAAPPANQQDVLSISQFLQQSTGISQFK